MKADQPLFETFILNNIQYGKTNKTVDERGAPSAPGGISNIATRYAGEDGWKNRGISTPEGSHNGPSQTKEKVTFHIYR